MPMNTTTYNFTFEIKDETPLTETQLRLLRAGFAKVISSYIVRRKTSASAVIGQVRETVIIKSEQS